MSRSGPLAGRTVLVLRPEERGGALARRLRELGAKVELAPAIAFEPPRDEEAARRAVAAAARYDLVVFTSATGVAAFEALAVASSPSGIPAGLRAAAIGPATARALRERGIAPAIVAADSRSEGLAAALAGEQLAGQRVLLVRPEVAREILPEALAAAGALVDSVAFYRTVPSAEALRAIGEVAARRVDAVVFTSPSTLEALLSAGEAARLDPREALRPVARVAIGPVTAAALAAHGIAASAVASSPAVEAVAAAVESALRPSRPVC